MTALLARVPLLRLARTPRAWMPILGWTLVAIVSAIALRSRMAGADHVLRGTFGVVVLPLAIYGVVGATFGAGGLKKSIRGVVGLGASPRAAAFASVLVAVLASAVVGALLAALTCAIAHSPGDAPLGRDVATSTWIGGLGGAAYAAYFSVGAAIGKGSMRSALVAVDWILGSAGGVGAVLVPRGHVLSLLGGAMPAEVSQRGSSALLLIMVVMFGALAVWIARR